MINFDNVRTTTDPTNPPGKGYVKLGELLCDTARMTVPASLNGMHDTIDITVIIIDLDPEGAAHLLKSNPRNRSIREANVRRIVADLLAGMWVFDGAPIRVSSEGELLDGQHRLTALVRAGDTNPDVRMRVLLMAGLAPSAQLVMDGGVRRTAGEQLGLYNVPNYLQVAAMLSVVRARRDNIWLDTASKRAPIGLSHSEAFSLMIMTGEDKIQHAVQYGVRTCKLLPGASPAVFSGMFLEFAEIDNEWAIDFYDRIAESRTKGKGDPVFALMLRFMEDAKYRRAKMSHAAQVFCLIKAWNADRMGHELARIKLVSQNGPLELPAVI